MTLNGRYAVLQKKCVLRSPSPEKFEKSSTVTLTYDLLTLKLASGNCQIVSTLSVCVYRRHAVLKSCSDGALLQPPSRMPACRPRDRDRDRHGDSPSHTAVASPSSSSTDPLLDLASPTAPGGGAQRSPRSPSTAASGGSMGAVQAAHSCPSAASDDDSGCALEEYAWVPPGLSALQVFFTHCTLLQYNTVQL